MQPQQIWMFSKEISKPNTVNIVWEDLTSLETAPYSVKTVISDNFSSNLVERVDFSDSRVALLWTAL